MATTFGDITDLQQPHHPQNIPRLVEKIKGLPLKANLKNARGRGGPSTPPLCSTVGA